MVYNTALNFCRNICLVGKQYSLQLLYRMSRLRSCFKFLYAGIGIDTIHPKYLDPHNDHSDLQCSAGGILANRIHHDRFSQLFVELHDQHRRRIYNCLEFLSDRCGFKTLHDGNEFRFTFKYHLPLGDFMKRLVLTFSLLGFGSLAYGSGSQTALTVSSGTFQAVSMYSNNDGANRQAIVIGDFTSSDTARVDQVTGIRVSLSTSSLTTSGAVNTVSSSTVLAAGSNQIGSISNTGFNVNNSPSVFVATTSVSISGSSNTVRINDGSGNSLTSTGNALDINIKSGSIANTGFNVNNAPTVITSTASVNGSTIAVVNAVGTKLLVTPDSVALPANQSVNLNQVGGSGITLGNNTMANSVPATIASNQSGIPVTSTSTQISGTPTVSISSISGSALSLGNNTMANSLPMTMASNQTPFGVNFSTVGVNQSNTAIVFVSTFANVAASQTGQVLVSTVSATTKICIHEMAVVAGGTATTFVVNDSSSGAITSTFANAANGGEILPWSPVPWACTLVNQALTVTTGPGSTTGVHIVYGKE